MKFKAKTRMSGAKFQAAAFTLMELLVALALMALVVPIVVQAMRVATLAGEVSQRKAIAARIGERVLNEAIINNTQGGIPAVSSGDEKSGDYPFHWQTTDKPWDQLGTLTVSTSPNGVNQSGVSSSVIHEFSVDVTFAAQNKNFDVHLSTLINISP